MQGTTQNYTLDMADGTAPKPLIVKQGDTNSREARISLTAFKEPWTIPFGCQIHINVRKNDMTYANATCTQENEHTVLAPITEQMTAVPGTQLGELFFLGSDGDIRSQTFPLVVWDAVSDLDLEASSNDFQALKAALRDVKISTDAAGIATQYATEQGNAAGMAAQRAEDAADSIQVAVDAAAAAKDCESNARDSELAAAQTQQEVTDYVEAQKAAFMGYSKRESDSKYANAIIKTASGEGGVTVEDAWTAPVLGLDVAGKSEQVTTTGANLFDIVHADNIKGVASGDELYYVRVGQNSAWVESTKIPFAGESNVIYTLSAKVKCGTATNLGIAFCYSDGTFEMSNRVNDTTYGKVKVTSKADKTVNGFGFIYVSADTSGYIKDIQLQKGSTATTFEPYTGGAPSPSPDYPQDIISVGTVSTGKQLLNADTIVQGMVNADTGELSSSSIAVSSDYIEVRPGNYFLSGDGLKPYLNRVVFYDAEKAYISSDSVYAKNGLIIVPDGAAYMRLRFVGAENIIPADIKALKPMLNAGDTALPWEPYTGGKPSPSVEYPQTIDIQCSVGNRNLLKKSGNTITTNSYLMKQYNFGDIKPLDGEKYTIQIKGILGKGKSGISIFNSGGYVFETSLYPENRDSNGIYKKSFTWKSKNDAYIADDTFIYVYAVPGSVDVKSTIEWIKLEKGELATPWIPAPEDITSENAEQYSDIIRTVPITLTEPLRGIGDYRDRIMCRDGVWGVERWIGAVDNAQWRMTNIVSGTFGHRFVQSLNNILLKNHCDIICTKYRHEKTSSYSSDGDYISSDERGSIHVRTLNPDFETVGAFKEFMADAVTLYPLATPTWEPLPDATQQALNALTTYAGTTHLTITAGGTTPTVTLDYVKDTHKALEQCQEAAREYTDNQIAAIVAALPTATQAAIVDTQITTLLKEV